MGEGAQWLWGVALSGRRWRQTVSGDLGPAPHLPNHIKSEGDGDLGGSQAS